MFERIIAIEVKRASRVRAGDLRGLKAFKTDYPQANAMLLCGETRERTVDDIRILPLAESLTRLGELI